MIAESIEEFLALVKVQRLLSLRENDIHLSRLVYLVLGVLALAITADYVYMIYLHYRMVRRCFTVCDTSLRTLCLTCTSIATRSFPPSHYRKYTPSPRREAMDILRAASKGIQVSNDHILDRTSPDNMDLRCLGCERAS